MEIVDGRRRTDDGGPREGTLKFSVYIGEADFFGVKILNFRIFGVFRKTSYFLG